ncbi:NADP-dependent oxidoreductase domain-containing protein [Mycena albidolilacea]|uniref:NADP-dependent oxidoreductase domain-containing protein n=1 Tax=Mycena albidolilacea TaxID=1033008 RepID=A0AAD6ZHV2_9AGAR|nr:NADP-dependent oxidoreductase domain-containing protein [Mycena albidolilacea]
MAAIPSIKLNTGALIPAIGLGAAPGDFTPQAAADSEKWILTGLQAGYRHIDTAYMYGTETYVGAAVRASGLAREEVFVTTKLPWHHPKYVVRSFDESLSNLGLGYVDLYLLHWPQTVEYPNGYDAPPTSEMFGELKVAETPTFNKTWAEFERLHGSGRARAIGVSNFSIKTLEQLFKTAKIVPAVNQVEMHPYLAQTELLEYCRKKGIVVTAYSPSGHDKVRSDPTIVALANKYKVSPTQIILAWHLGRGVVALPKSSNAGRQKENLTLPTLSVADLASVTALDRNERINGVGPNGKAWGWTAEQYGW